MRQATNQVHLEEGLAPLLTKHKSEDRSNKHRQYKRGTHDCPTFHTESVHIQLSLGVCLVRCLVGVYRRGELVLRIKAVGPQSLVHL
jgi:hypothetical protein